MSNQGATPEKVMIARVGAAEAERLKSRLAVNGIEVACVHNGMTCKTGCSIQLEVWAHPADVPEIGRFLDAERQRSLADLGADVTLLDEVFDVDAAEATCPACGTRFATSHRECPDCGLAFVVPNNV